MITLCIGVRYNYMYVHAVLERVHVLICHNTITIVLQTENVLLLLQNVVVVSQPSASQPAVVEVEPNDHLLFAVISFIICALLGNCFGFIFLIPALILSIAVSF